jgi:DNA invertase Pin-like site-specific DNA recombinase
MAKPKPFETFKKDFDALSVDGCIGSPDGQPVYLYIRVSSHEQAEEGHYGLPRQIEHCHEIAKQRGYKISWVMVFADDHTGFEFRDRPELTRLRHEYTSPHPKANAVVMEHVDRLSRNSEWHQGFLLDEMKQNGTEAIFWKAFNSRVERTVMGIIAQDGMEQAQQRMMDGHIRKAKMAE